MLPCFPLAHEGSVKVNSVRGNLRQRGVAFGVILKPENYTYRHLRYTGWTVDPPPEQICCVHI